MTANSYEKLKHRISVALILNAIIILAELAGGYFSRSIGLMSDAMHNSIDQGALFLSLYAHILSIKPATSSKTFGYHRFGIVATFVNTLVLLLTACVLGGWGIFRMFHPVPISGLMVIVIALASSLANFGIAMVLHQWSKGNLNIRSAFLHMLSDAWVSLGVVASAIGILLTHWLILDPLISLVIVAVILKGAWPLFNESLDILLEGRPTKLDTAQIINAIQKIPGVKNVHDLHVWGIEPRIPLLTCHVTLTEEALPTSNALLKLIRKSILEECGILHQTIQIEDDSCHLEEIHCNLERSINFSP